MLHQWWYEHFHSQPTGSTKLQSILITPDNVRYLASFIDSSATIDSHSIRFSSGTTHEKLLEVVVSIWVDSCITLYISAPLSELWQECVCTVFLQEGATPPLWSGPACQGLWSLLQGCRQTVSPPLPTYKHTNALTLLCDGCAGPLTEIGRMETAVTSHWSTSRALWLMNHRYIYGDLYAHALLSF